MRIVLLAVLSLLVYANTLFNEFTFDDQLYVLHNSAVQNVSVRELFAPTRHNNVLRPFTFASFALNWAVGGARPFGYHLLNLLLHAAVVLLLYLLLKVLLESVSHGATVAFAAALLFAVHPIHTEAVASISARSELLAAGFLLAAWLLHLSDREVPALVCLVFALMSKESAVVFLPLALAGDYARGKLKPLLRYGVMAGITVVYMTLFWKLKGGRFGEVSVSFVDDPLASLPAGLRILNALRIAWKYVALHIYPATLSCDYSYNAILLYANWRHLLLSAAAALLVVAVWIWAFWTRRNQWFLAGAVYLLAFSVTANLLTPTGTIMAERLAYLPSAGFCLLAALVWIHFENRRSAFAWALLSLLVLILAARTVVRNRDWKDDFSLFSAAASTVPGSAKVHSNLGVQYALRGQLDLASAQYQMALRIYPDYTDAMASYGLLQSFRGRQEEARKLLETALSRTPKTSINYDAMAQSLAVVLIKLGDNDKALKLLDAIIQESPASSVAWSNRAAALFQAGDRAAARSDAETALRLNPSNSQAQNLLRALEVSGSSPH